MKLLAMTKRMKMKRLHTVPLAPQAVQVLRTLQEVSGDSELLFAVDRDRKKPMSNNTILKALERMEYKGKMTGQGFRGLPPLRCTSDSFRLTILSFSSLTCAGS